MYIRFYFYYISILVLFSKNDKIEKILYNFFKSIIFILIFLVLFHLQQIIFGFDTIDNRITIPIRQEEIAVSIYTKFYPFILMILLFSSKSQKNDEFFKKYKSIIIALSILTPIIVIFSVERMNSLMFFGFVIFILFKYNIKNSFYFFTSIVILFLIFDYLDFFNSSDRIKYIFNRYSIFFSTLNNNFLLDSTWGNHFLAAFNIFQENYLNGIGIKEFRIECSAYVTKFKFACTSHPHNIYLEIAAETGIITLICFILIFLKVLKIFITNTLQKEFKTTNIFIYCLSICILIYAFPLRSTGSFFNNYNSSFFWVYLGLLISLYDNKKKN